MHTPQCIALLYFRGICCSAISRMPLRRWKFLEFYGGVLVFAPISWTGSLSLSPGFRRRLRNTKKLRESRVFFASCAKQIHHTLEHHVFPMSSCIVLSSKSMCSTNFRLFRATLCGEENTDETFAQIECITVPFCCRRERCSCFRSKWRPQDRRIGSTCGLPVRPPVTMKASSSFNWRCNGPNMNSTIHKYTFPHYLSGIVKGPKGDLAMHEAVMHDCERLCYRSNICLGRHQQYIQEQRC